MVEQLTNIFSKISIPHLNILFLLGLALFGGTVGGRLFQKLKIPQVVGYIAIGIAIGETGLRIVGQDTIQILQPFNYFALGLIGFMVGGELKKDVLLKYGKQFITILLWEGVTPFVLVTILVGSLGGFIFGWKLSWALGLLLGSIASATDPATTTEVFREYKTKGPLTTIAMGIVALDDGLALFLFAIASSVAGNLSGNVHENILRTILSPAFDLGGSILLGAALGFVLHVIIKKYSEKERLLAFAVGIVLIITGLSLALNLEMLLVAMTAGIIVVNFTPQKSKEIFQLLGGFTPPIYVLFFVLIGAKLNFSHMTKASFILVGIYLFGTMVGKVVGSEMGARISGAPKTVRKYLPLSLFAQAGIAIGLSILAAQYFPGEIADTLVVVVTATTFTLQLIGPPCTKIAVTKAGEVGLNVTEEDIIQQSKASDVMDKNPPLVYENMQLPEILKIFSENDNLYYPVVNKHKELKGILTVEGIKQTLLDMDVGSIILAHDLMERVVAKTSPDTPITVVKEMLNGYNIEYLPVIDRIGRLEGFIERQDLNRFISNKVIASQKLVDSLG